MASRARLELEEAIMVQELNLKRIALKRAQIAEDLARLDVNEQAAQAAIKEQRAKLAALDGEEG